MVYEADGYWVPPNVREALRRKPHHPCNVWLRTQNLSLITRRHQTHTVRDMLLYIKRKYGGGRAAVFKNVTVTKDKERLLEMFQIKEG